MATTEKETKKKKPLKLSRPGRLELKKTVEGGQVKQSFSHGRSKTVTVEVKKKRTFRQGDTGEMTEVTQGADALAEAEAAFAAKAPEPAEEAKPARTLTRAEQDARARALEEAKRDEEKRAEEAEQRAIEEAKRAKEEAEKKAAEPAPEPETAPAEAEPEKPAVPLSPAEQRRLEEQARAAAEAEAARLTEEASQRAAQAAERRRAEGEEEAESEGDGEAARGRDRAAKGTPAPRAATPRTERRRRSGKLTISEALDEEGGARQRSVAAFRRRQERERQRARRDAGSGQSQQKIVRDVQIPDTITVAELANRMAERGSEVIKALMKMGVMATINQTIDQDTAQLVVEEFGHNVRRISAADVEVGLGSAIEDDEAARQPRAPVVTVMGHVDHGKTSLLDALRETNVVSREAGGITQHIGAYQVEVPSGEKITFLDTPGHEAFTAMRQRGATVTDIVVLVVAADDGVQPQTVEAINHARAAGVPMIVAINKVDRAEADVTRIKNELLTQEVVPEEMGGDVQCIEVSALQKTGLDTLTESIVLQAEILELKANPDRAAFGAIVEAKLEKGRGSVATVLVQGGTLKVGDIFVAGAEWGRVRALFDERGEAVEAAGPSVPVEVLGFNGTPAAGDEFAVVDSEARAREVAEYRGSVIRDQRAAEGARGTLDEMFQQIAAGEAAQVPVVIKGDVQGSVEAIMGALDKMSTEEVKVQVLHSGVGGVNESDVSLAAASKGLIVGFNVRAIPQAREQAKRDGVDIRYYNVIYDVVDDVKALMEGELSPHVEENHIGTADIREVFQVSKVGKVAGCMITDGMVRRGSKVRLLRDSVVVWEGNLAQLKRFKDDVREVQNGYECGMALENYNDIQVGDQIECFELKETARQL